MKYNKNGLHGILQCLLLTPGPEDRCYGGNGKNKKKDFDEKYFSMEFNMGIKVRKISYLSWAFFKVSF